MKKETFRYWLCESGIHDTKFSIDYDTYIKVQYDLTLEKINYRLVNLSEFVIDFEMNEDSYLFDYYIIVDKQTYLQYSEI